MPPLLVQPPTGGLNGQVPDSLLASNELGKFSQNIILERGLSRVPTGFAKLDLATGLNSSELVQSVFPFRELDGFTHLMAKTLSKIFDHDRVNSEWDDKTQSGKDFDSNIDNPIGFVQVGHSSAITLNDVSGATSAFHHLIVSDGGLSDIQRWAGRFEDDFADLVGAGDYHDGTTHRAWDIGSFRSRLILMSPETFASSNNQWTENNQQIRWPTINKIETWTGTGSGAVTLIDTGGLNICGANLGPDFIIYQDRGVWSLNYVGGTTVFDPRPQIPNLGLLSYHLLVRTENTHYFIGDDFNVYAYFGGTVFRKIGDKIQRFIEDESDATLVKRMWMALSPDNKRLGVFIVPSGQSYMTRAFWLDFVTGSWMQTEYSDAFSTDNGFTAISLIGSETIETGDSYKTELATLSPFDSDISTGTVGDTTIKYGDELRGDMTSNLIDWSTIADAGDDLDFTDLDFSKVAAGLEFDYSSGSDNTIILNDPTTLWSDWSTTSSLIMRIDDGSATTGMPHGTHYYQFTDVCAVNNAGDWSITVHIAPRDGSDYGAAVASGTTTEEFNAAGEVGETTGTLFDPSGVTYNQEVNQIRIADRIVAGDATGFVYQFGEETDYAGFSIVSKHYTKPEDWGMPGTLKRWRGLEVVAKEGTAGNGALNVRFRTADFDTSETGWNDVTFDISSNMKKYNVWTNTTSEQIQFNIANAAESDFVLSEYRILEPEVQENR